MKWLLIIFFTGICATTYAQQKNDADYFFLTDTVITSFGKTFSNKLKVINNTPGAITLFKDKETADNGHALISIPDTITLQGGSSQAYPVKYFPSAKQYYKISFKASPITVNMPDSAVFYARIDEPNRLRISALEPDLYLDPQTGKLSFRLRCQNDGYLPVQIRILLNSYPEGLQFEKQTGTITLAAGSQQIITLDAKNLLGKGYAPDFNVNLLAQDLQGNTLATTNIRIISLTSNKRLATGYNQYANLLNNSVELNYVNLNKDFTFYQLRGKGNIQSSDRSAINYNLNLNYYSRQNTMDAYDTWLSYSNKRFGVLLGNIAENLDYSLYGRGIKASAFLDEKSGFDLYYVNNNYLLFSGTRQLFSNANTYATSYHYGKPDERNGRLSFIYNNDPYTKLKTGLINGEATVISTSEKSLVISAGYSYENSMDTAISKPGYAAGATYTVQKNKWNLNLNNYFSSNHYSGLRRGVIQLEERFRYTPDPLTGLYVRYSLLKNSPRYLSQAWLSPNNNNQISIYEIGISRRISALSLTFYPYFLVQDLNDQYFTRKDLHSSSARAALDANYSFGTAMLALNADYGYTKSNNGSLKKENYHSFKVNGNFSAKYWGINARIQTNPYYLQEELIGPEQEKYRQYSIGPNLHLSAFKQRMEISLTGYANYNSYGFGWNNTVDGQVRYRMNTWQFSAQAFYNAYSNLANSASTQLRIGIQKSFASANAPGLKKLELVFFGDDNANGTWDNGEKLLEGVIVDVAGVTAISNPKGRIVYSNLEKGEKTVQVKQGKGWDQLEPLKLLLLNNQNIRVPLVKSGRLTGQVVPLAQKYVTEKPMLEGIRVIATDKFQRTFFTLTDETGNFYFSLPIGHYVVHIETAGQLFSIKDARKEVTLNEKNNALIVFEWADERRKTEVKRF